MDVAYKIDPDGKLEAQQPGHPQPAHLRRQGRLARRHQAAGAAGRGAAEGPQRRDRHQPADQRLDQRPAVQRRRHRAEGHRQPARQGADRAVRAARRRRQRRPELGRASSPAPRRVTDGRPQRDRQGGQGAGRPPGAEDDRHRRQRPGERARGDAAGRARGARCCAEQRREALRGGAAADAPLPPLDAPSAARSARQAQSTATPSCRTSRAT